MPERNALTGLTIALLVGTVLLAILIVVQPKNPVPSHLFFSDEDEFGGADTPIRDPRYPKGDNLNPPSVFRTIVPSTAPLVKPPTPIPTPAPAAAGAKPERIRNITDCPQIVNSTDSRIKNPTDARNRALPKCDDPRFNDGTSLGHYKERGYTYKENECHLALDDSDFEFVCTGHKPKFCAVSYDTNGRACACGGLPMKSGTCVIAKQVSFTYDEALYTKAQSQPTCTTKTEWKLGTFHDGRYSPPGNCTILDVNPRSLIKWFPNKFIFMNGDSHQEDKIWGFLGEVRNQRLTYVVGYGDRWGKDLRYEVTEKQDLLELFHHRQMKIGDPEFRKCKISSPCTVIAFRFDRFEGDYIYTAQSLEKYPPDYYIGAWLSATYSNPWDAQFKTKAAWEKVLKGSTHPVSMAWTSFPRNSGFIISNVTEWINGLNMMSLKHHFALTENDFWEALSADKVEPGKITFDIIWHDNCHVGDLRGDNKGKADKIIASETCLAIIPKLLYRVILSLLVM